MFKTKLWINLLQRFRKNTDGATAVEFAILALPFLTLLFAILEIAVIFFLDSTLNHGTQEAARRIRTGEYKSACTADIFADRVCEAMGGGSCENLFINVKSDDTGTFSAGMITLPPPVVDPDDPTALVPAPSTYQDSGPRDVVVVQSRYYYKLAFPGNLTFLANRPDNTRLITATTAFRNEPFPDGC